MIEYVMDALTKQAEKKIIKCSSVSFDGGCVSSFVEMLSELSQVSRESVLKLHSTINIFLH